MRKTAIVGTAAIGLLLAMASPAAADTPATTTIEWAADDVPDTTITGTLGTIEVTASAGSTQKTSTTVDWSTAEGSDATTAGGITSTSALHLSKPAGSNTFVTVNFSEPVVDAVLFIAHGTPGLGIFPPLGPVQIEGNNTTGNSFNDAATGSVDDGLSMLYPGSRSVVSFFVSHPSATTFTMSVGVPSSIAQDVAAETVEDTPVVVAPTVTPATGRTVDPSTTRLIDDDGDPVTSLSTAAGTYTVDTASGFIAFTPAPGFTGDTVPVQFRVTDSAGIYAAAFLSVEVAPEVPVPVVDPLLLAGAAAVIVPATIAIRRRRRLGSVEA